MAPRVEAGTDVFKEGNPTHQFHCEEPERAVRHELIKRNEIRMRDIRERAKLSLEAIIISSLCARERLSGEHLVGFAIVRLVHYAHAARTQAAPDPEPVSAKEIAGSCGH